MTREVFYSLTLSDGRVVKIYNATGLDLMKAFEQAGGKIAKVPFYLCIEIITINGKKMEGLNDWALLSAADTNAIMDVVATLITSTPQ